jgi:hypothetical protein
MTRYPNSPYLIPLALLLVFSQGTVAQVSAQDGASRGVVSANSPPQSNHGVASSQVPNSSGVQNRLSSAQCDRIREKVARSPSLKSTFSSQLSKCDSQAVSTTSSERSVAPRSPNTAGVQGGDIPEKGR